MTDLAVLRSWRTMPLLDASLDLWRLRQQAVETAQGLMVIRGSLMFWGGEAADAARANLTRQIDHHGSLAVGFGGTSALLRDAMHSLDSAQDMLRRAEELAYRVNVRIADNGTLLMPVDPPSLDSETSRRREEALPQIRALLFRSEHAALDADRRLAAGLLQACQLGLNVRNLSFDWQGGASFDAGDWPVPDLPQDAEHHPFAVAAWWRGLTVFEQDKAIRDNADALGNLDGIPVDVRDRINRERLDRLEADLRGDWHGGDEAFPGLASDRRAPNLVVGTGIVGGWLIDAYRDQCREEELDKVAHLRSALEDKEGLPASLLVLHAPALGNWRVAVGVGDLNAARHVTTFVPGMGSGVQNVAGYADDVAKVVVHAQHELREHPDSSGSSKDSDVAGAVWIDYDAPSSADVLSPISAHEGAPRLATFLRGVDAQSEGGTYQNLIGHSYGSLLAAQALQAHTGVDSFLAVGSPGMEIHSVAEIDVPPGAASRMDANEDLISWFRYYGNRPEGFIDLATDASVVDGKQLTACSGHSEYFKEGSTCQNQIVNTVLNRPANWNRVR